MDQRPLPYRPFDKEYEFQTSRSGGPGGQHVNKTETKVELRFHVDNSQLLSDEEKEMIKEKQRQRINNDGFLQVFAQEYRSQRQNKELAIKRFFHYLSESLKKKKKRLPTKPSKQAVEKRIKGKKKLGEKKVMRGRVDRRFPE
jgi:ribosome-associated protein